MGRERKRERKRERVKQITTQKIYDGKSTKTHVS